MDCQSGAVADTALKLVAVILWMLSPIGWVIGAQYRLSASPRESSPPADLVSPGGDSTYVTAHFNPHQSSDGEPLNHRAQAVPTSPEDQYPLRVLAALETVVLTLESDLLVAAVTEGLVARMTAAAQGGLAAFGGATAIGADYGHRARGNQHGILTHGYLERTLSLL